jgi:hypothetical protein
MQGKMPVREQLKTFSAFKARYAFVGYLFCACLCGCLGATGSPEVMWRTAIERERTIELISSSDITRKPA